VITAVPERVGFRDIVTVVHGLNRPVDVSVDITAKYTNSPKSQPGQFALVRTTLVADVVLVGYGQLEGGVLAQVAPVQIFHRYEMLEGSGTTGGVHDMSTERSLKKFSRRLPQKRNQITKISATRRKSTMTFISI